MNMEKRNKHYSMPESINNNSLQGLNKKLQQLHAEPGFSNAVEVVNSVIALLGVLPDSWKLFNDDRGKIKSNSGWFMVAEGFADRRATYKIADTNEKNIDFKAYWLKKISKSTISWVTALTPNFEDEPFYQNKNIGIDFVISPKADKVVVVLTKNYSIRTLELTSTLTTTQHEIFAKWLRSFDFTNKAQTHQILWDSFDLESVNRQFYKQISGYFTELKQYLTANCNIEEKSAAHFTNRLIGRMVFCWFLLKKGIINPNISYFDPLDKDSTSYYKEKLEVLFFKVFNTPQQERESGADAETPFLNGGLFEPRKGDFVNDKKLSFPSDYFNRLIQTLSHYNFTTDESTSTFQQVAIDPEMLGRIFENLLAEQVEETGEQARKAKGAFYTPREIVDYMCRESLREHLKSKIPDDEYRDQRISELLDKKPHEIEDKSKTNLRRDLKSYKEEIIRALDDLTVLDPACGSGAFPMGMMHLLAQCYERLEPRFEPYKTKLGIIKNNIFGVDIEPMAIEISRLRAWLSIIVDEDSDSKKIEPLPNLDFKFVCANSLIPLSSSTNDVDIKGIDEEMKVVRDEHFSTKSRSKKETLVKRYEKLLAKARGGGVFSSEREKQISTYHPFDSESVCQFFDPLFMFGVDQFSIVIGNPPYGGVYTDDHKQIFAEKYESTRTISEKQKGSFDTFSLFIERGLNLADSPSTLNYIVPLAVTSSDSMSALHNMLYKICDTIKISSYSNRPMKIFESADQRVSIILCRKTNTPTEHIYTTKVIKRYSDVDIQQIIDTLSFVDSINFVKYGRIPKVGSSTELSILNKLSRLPLLVTSFYDNQGDPLYYRTSGGRYYNIITNFKTGSSKEKALYIKPEFRDVIAAILSSNLYFWFYHIYSNNLDLKTYEIESFPIPSLENFTTDKMLKIQHTYKLYLEDLHIHSKLKQVNYAHTNEYREYYARYSKKYIDLIDKELQQIYGLDDVEIEFIVNYDLKFRTNEE